MASVAPKAGPTDRHARFDTLPSRIDRSVNRWSSYVADLVAGLGALRTEGRGPILAAVAVGWFLSIGLRLVYPALLPELRRAYDLDLTTAGLLLSVLWVAYAVGQLPGGVLADRIGEGRILWISTAISTGTIALVATAGSVSVLFGATALFGLGTALYGVARYTALSGIYPENDGAAVGVTLAAGEVGNAILPPFAGLLAATFAWQLGFGFAVPLFVLVSVSLWIVLPARTSAPTSAVDSLSFETARYVLSSVGRPTIVLVTAVQVLGFSVWQAYTGFYPTYLIEVKGLSYPAATTLFGLFFALGIVVQPVSGAAYDRFGLPRTAAVVLGIAALGLAALPVVSTLPAVVLATAFSSALLGLTVMTMPYLTAALPDDMQGTGLGFLRTVYMLIGAASPTVAGAIADRGFFDEVFFLLAGLVAVAIALSTLVPRG